jgi:acyl-CoA thioesterase YciA
MSIIDDAAASFVSQLCDTPKLVTIKFDELVFKRPVNSGSILKNYGRVIKLGNTSIEVYIEVREHKVYTAEQHIVTHTGVTMVRVDGDGKSIPISDLVKIKYKSRIKKFVKVCYLPKKVL